MPFLSLAVLLFMILLLVFSNNASDIGGFKPLQELDLSSLEKYSPKLDQDVKVFFEQRNIMEITVPQKMTVGMFMERYVKTRRKEAHASMACKLHVTQLPDNYMLSAGDVFKIELTPRDKNSLTCQ